MKTCKKCLINENYPGIDFNREGICSLCYAEKVFKPWGEKKLLEIFLKAKKQNQKYDALVPLSGGKDSTYILHLAVHKYKLRVLAMTYDNGFFNQIALDNIEQALNVTGADHVFCKTDPEVQRKVYQTMFLKTGDVCGACDIATRAHILKTAKENDTALILYGNAPLEEDSFVPDSIQDIARFKYIMRKSKTISRKAMNYFLVYPRMNYFKLSLWKKTGLIPKEVSPLFFIDNPSDQEMGEIIKREMNWTDGGDKHYTKHFDCVAEPLTNYVRHKIYGYERRLCQYSTMVRRGELDRPKAEQLYQTDLVGDKPANYQDVLGLLDLSEKDLETIVKIEPLKYERHTSKMNKLYAKLMELRK